MLIKGLFFMKRALLLIWLLLVPTVVLADWDPAFTVHKFGTGSPVVLIVGGIQGDEPGGFSAAALLATQYRFTRGSIWVVPNLNFPSIIHHSRGDHSDMNRKFAHMAESDPDYATVRRIQKLITAPEVDLVLNLHDGSGFYRPTYEDKKHNPHRWGQSVIFDMSVLDGHPLGDLEGRARRVVLEVNKALLQPGHVYHTMNTHTDRGHPEMEKTLSWFAVRNGKPAYGIEASKEFTVPGRTYYHLQVIEVFLRLAGLEFERSFPLTFKGVRAALQSDLSVAFAGDRFRLPLEDVRPRLRGYIPLPRDLYADLSLSKPILAVLRDQNELRVHYGNRLLTRFTPEWHDCRFEAPDFSVVVDGQPRTVRVGEIVPVRERFVVQSAGLRINAIGTGRGPDESNTVLCKKDFRPDYSVDTGGTIFRVEGYYGKEFAGMFLVCFKDRQATVRRESLPGAPGPESDLGK
ncbi:MAG: succinylglutamate desuccinylase/aspartoacylase family protein [Deltaproteobacteria bacterium]|jgi:hypothetical protein|nr:succinylglutamate desuccinylase/aspartoacylase family protein [Deltaproteobacteria bacterium]